MVVQLGDVLKGRFELGESAIAAEPLYNQEYKQFIGIALFTKKVQCPYEEEKGYIYIADDYTNNILKLSGYSDIDQGDFNVL